MHPHVMLARHHRRRTARAFGDRRVVERGKVATDFVDLKSPFMGGHSGVSTRAAAALRATQNAVVA